MKLIKKFLFKILPERIYLKILHRFFYILYDLKLLKKNKSFKYHYKVKELIHDGDVIIDIGANLGYFSKTFSRLSPNGKVLCVEPLPQYYSILKYFLGARKNVEIHNVALGKNAGEVTMILPKSDGMIRTGLPYISKPGEKSEHPTQQVKIVNPKSLLNDFSKIDYIKCDIEGFEWIVFQELKEILIQYQPMVQIEISKENTGKMIPFFIDLGYVQYGISNFKIIQENGKQIEPGDYLFVPKIKEKMIMA
jgi:FkbM family methyltransferase